MTKARNVTIKEIEQLGGTDVYVMANHAQDALVVAGLADGYHTPAFNWDHRALAAYIGPQLVGLITYNVMGWNKDIWIGIGWVEPAHRRKGIYRQLYTALRSLRDAKFPDHTITGATSVRNKPLQKSAEAFGRVPKYVAYTDYPACRKVK